MSLNLMFIFMVFLFVFNIKLNFFPYYSNLVFSVLGVGVVLFFFLRNPNLHINRSIFKLLFLMLCIPFSFCVSLLFNSDSNDFYYLKTFFLNNLVYLFSAIFLFFYFFRVKGLNYDDYIKWLAIVVSLQLIFSMIGFLNSSFFDFIFKFIAMERDFSTLGDMSEYRLVGIGASFFGSGVINTITLLLIADSIVRKNNKNFLILILCFIVIAFIGVLSSRTTIVGLILSCFIFLINLKSNIKLVYAFCAAFLSFIIVYPVLSVYNDRVATIFDFGLSFIFDFSNSEAASSVGVLQEYFKIIPDNFKTWLIGDARFGDQMVYYKNTDVGFYRIIFCTGIMGLLAFFVLQFYVLFEIKNSYLKRTNKVLIFAALVILNFKGVASFFVILILPYLLSVDDGCQEKDVIK